MTDEQPPEDLSHAGAVVDKAIQHMIGQNIGALSIASALLGGAMALLARDGLYARMWALQAEQETEPEIAD